MNTKPIKILLVEDDEDDYYLVRDVTDSIDRVSYDITWCDTFEKARGALAAKQFDVALIDYRIGGQTGIEFVKVAKDDGVDVPMILLTGLQDSEIDIAASAAGAVDYLNKGELTPAVVERAIRFACANAASQRSLAERSALLQTTLDNTGSGLAAFDADENLVAYNQRFCEQICQLGPQIGPVALQTSCGQVNADALQFSVSELLRGLDVETSGRNELQTFDEAILDLSINKTEAGGSVVVVRDVTEQKFFEQNLTRAKEDAEAANRAKTAFLATMSHELRTPLNAIIGFSDLILNGTRGELQPEAYREYINDIHSSGRHLLGIINEILDFAKAEAGNAEINKDDLRLQSELEFCLRLMMPHAEKSRVKLQSDFQDFNGYILADQTAFRRIVINILSNAIKFTPEGGLVRLSAKPLDDGSLKISVTDTGIGIPEEDLPLVIQPFYQVHSEIERSYDGTGLGLSIVSLLTQLHEASLKVDSVFGIGTTVTLDFPQHTVKPEESDAPSWQVALKSEN